MPQLRRYPCDLTAGDLPGPGTPPQPPGPWTATVPRRLVHRAAVAETLLTGWQRTAADRFTLFVQWPRAHLLHVSADRTAYEPLLVAETVRQCGALITHAEYGVPLDDRFVLQTLHVATRPEHLAVGAAPAEPVVHLAATPLRHRGGRPTALACDAEVRLGGERVATAHLDVSWTSAAVYRRLRGGRTPDTVSALPPPPALPAAAVGRAVSADVVLAPPDRPGRWQLRVDTAHPVFFDHPLDHVPGMLFLEAARQAAWTRYAGRAVPASFRAAFHRYAELDSPVWIEADDDGEGGVRVRGSQGESRVFECAVGTAVP
ncbi:ScbA/BarX family gamma-butyrolactone biosynthesis protein [Streptomyces sp. 7R007]